jgi:hypothetical protein
VEDKNVSGQIGEKPQDRRNSVLKTFMVNGE